jgi:hypothetical protein
MILQDANSLIVLLLTVNLIHVNSQLVNLITAKLLIQNLLIVEQNSYLLMNLLYLELIGLCLRQMLVIVIP